MNSIGIIPIRSMDECLPIIPNVVGQHKPIQVFCTIIWLGKTNVSLSLCEAKPTTLKCPSPDDGFENHMHCTKSCGNIEHDFRLNEFQITRSHDVLLMLTSWGGKALAFSRVQPEALATHAFKDIPLAHLTLISLDLPSGESLTFSINLCT